MLSFKPPRIPLAQTPTPLKALDRLSEHIGGPRIWVKQDDLSGCVLSGNKIRKLEFVLAEARAQGCDTLITCGGLQSNHCRATAIVAAQQGMAAHLILRGAENEIPDGNLLLDYLSGAKISSYPEKQYFAELHALFLHWQRHYEAQGRKAHCIPTGASDEFGLWGYLCAAEELVSDMSAANFQADAVVVATGSGGTQGGLTLGMHLLSQGVAVYGMAVCDSVAYFRKKVLQDVSAWHSRWGEHFHLAGTADLGLNINTIDDYIGPGYAKTYPELFDCIRWVAQLEGLILDPVYTGKAFYGMLQEVKKGRFKEMENIIFVHTGGVFGLFPYKQGLKF
ncbi:D-cysteine desulfhydrase [Alteromonadaceae bacterium Bs31]|nr:D-cysteine desulfhydrase [Alteromonadaceae bacterium Bs31]